MLTTAALNDFRSFVKKKIWKAQYKIGSTWYDATISQSVITSAGVVRIQIPISPGYACTITGARLISTNNEVWAEKAISATIEDGSTNLLQWFEFVIAEKSEVS